MARGQTWCNCTCTCKKILKQAKGYYGARSRIIPRCLQGCYQSWSGTLTVTVVNVNVSSVNCGLRINAAARQNGISYNKFIQWPEKSLC